MCCRQAEPEVDHPPPDKNGGKLLKGDFNEDEEHKKFQQAVLQWRKEAKGEGPRRSSCWQCFKVLPHGAPLDFDGKNICSQRCLDQATQAKKSRGSRPAVSPTARQSNKGVFEASSQTAASTAAEEEYVPQEGEAQGIRYTGDDLNRLLDSESWKVAIDY